MTCELWLDGVHLTYMCGLPDGVYPRAGESMMLEIGGKEIQAVVDRIEYVGNDHDQALAPGYIECRAAKVHLSAEEE